MACSQSHKWTLEELDLNQQLVPLASLLNDKQQLVETLFSIVSSREIRQMMPDNIRDIPLEILKDICIIEMKDNRLLDDQTILCMLQPKGQSPDKNGDTAVASVVSSNELSDRVANEVRPNEAAPAGDNGSQVNERIEDSGPQTGDVFDVVDLRIRESLHLKHKIPLEELDLSREIVPISDKLQDPPALVDLLFTILTSEEIAEIKPSSLNFTIEELKGRCVQTLTEMTASEIGKALDRSTGVGIRPGGKRSDTLPAETNDDKSEEERKAGKKKKREGGKRGADAVEIKDPAMDEDRKEKQRRMDRGNETTAEEEAVPEHQEKDVGEKRAVHQELQEKDHPSNEKSNERWMNFCPEETRKEIEELEDRARTLRHLLRRLESDAAPKPSSELDMIVCCSRVREEDEDSLDRELIGADE